MIKRCITHNCSTLTMVIPTSTSQIELHVFGNDDVGCGAVLELSEVDELIKILEETKTDNNARG